MSTKEQPHYTLGAAHLAQWLEDQGSDSWWTVDGDPVLTERVSFPCPGDELAAAVRTYGKDLLLRDKDDRSDARGQSIDEAQLESLAYREGDRGDRVFQFAWKNDPNDNDWNLVEDKEVAIWAREAAMEE